MTDMTQIEPPHDPRLSLHDRHDRSGDRLGASGEVADPRQALLHLFRAGRDPCATPRAEGMDREIQGQVRSGLGQGPRGDACAAEGARRRARRTRPCAQARLIKDWDKLSADEKKLFARQMEVFAGFGEYADTEIGRLVAAIDDLGQLDNTLVFYIIGDNGASAEGGMNGLFNETTYFNRVRRTFRTS